MTLSYKEGSLDAPTRHPIHWKDDEYLNKDSLNLELERVYDICHGCRRCVNLCNAFPTLFDLIDESQTMEVDGVAKSDYSKVSDQCYLCDLCYMTKCPYVPPHEWNVDFPHLMLRSKAVQYKEGKTKLRDKILSSTDVVGNLLGIPVVAQAINVANRNAVMRTVVDKTFGIHRHAKLPEFHSNDLRKHFAKRSKKELNVESTHATTGKVAVFVTCYGNKNDPHLVEDMLTIFEHNGIAVRLTAKEKCCGMPMLELGNLDKVEQFKEFNIPELLRLIDEGWDIVAPIPSCVLMFKQELPLMFPHEDNVKKVQQRIFDPFEYLMLRHKAGKFDTNFKNSLGKIAYHVACHQRVQNIGMKTKDILELAPDTMIEVFERCSGHDGTYAVKSEYHETSMKICRPITSKLNKMDINHYISDCPMAANHISNGLENGKLPENAFSLLRFAYGLTS